MALLERRRCFVEATMLKGGASVAFCHDFFQAVDQGIIGNGGSFSEEIINRVIPGWAKWRAGFPS